MQQYQSQLVKQTNATLSAKQYNKHLSNKTHHAGSRRSPWSLADSQAAAPLE